MEEGAHAAQRGIGAGQFEVPAQWRRERKIDHLLAAPPLTVPSLGAHGHLAVNACAATVAAWQTSLLSLLFGMLIVHLRH